jgi:DNA-binding GntR family transcriptional regulator
LEYITFRSELTNVHFKLKLSATIQSETRFVKALKGPTRMNVKFSDGSKSDGLSKLDNDRIYAKVFEAIVDHRLLPGRHLKEDELCEAFDVGRTRIRSILSRLAADHVVVHVANTGVFVACPTIEEAREVFRARRAIETHLVRRVAENPNPQLRAALSGHMCDEHAARTSGDISAVIKKCGQYHQILADQADSPIMARFARELIARSSLIIAIFEPKPLEDCELEEHKLLTDLLFAGKADQAATLMEKHLLGIEGRLVFEKSEQGSKDLRHSILGGSSGNT